MPINHEAVETLLRHSKKNNDFLAVLLAADLNARGVVANVVEANSLSVDVKAPALPSGEVVEEAVILRPIEKVPQAIELQQEAPKPRVKEEPMRFPLPMFSVALMTEMNHYLTGLPADAFADKDSNPPNLTTGKMVNRLLRSSF